MTQYHKKNKKPTPPINDDDDIIDLGETGYNDFEPIQLSKPIIIFELNHKTTSYTNSPIYRNEMKKRYANKLKRRKRLVKFHNEIQKSKSKKERQRFMNAFVCSEIEQIKMLRRIIGFKNRNEIYKILLKIAGQNILSPEKKEKIPIINKKSNL